MVVGFKPNNYPVTSTVLIPALAGTSQRSVGTVLLIYMLSNNRLF